MRTAVVVVALGIGGLLVAADARPAERWEYGEVFLGPGMRGGARWVSGAGEIEADDWEELASRLKAPAMRTSNPYTHRLRVLNHLGGQGWELVSSTPAVLTFKRRLAK